MRLEHQLSDEAREEFRRALLDKACIAARVQYVSEILGSIINIEDWLAVRGREKVALAHFS